MSYQERRSIMNLISTLLITGFYSAFMLQRYPEGDFYSPEVFRFWGAFFVILIPVSVVGKIISYIAFAFINAAATRETDLPVTDERDRVIETKASRVSNNVFLLGFVLAMGSLVIDMPPAVMFITLLLAGVVSGIAGDMTQVYFYQRGG